MRIGKLAIVGVLVIIGFAGCQAVTSPSTSNVTVAPNAPVISPAGGSFGQTADNYAASAKVTLSCSTANASVYYTLDGTTPTTASIAYSAPFTLQKTSTVKAVAYSSGTASTATSAIFTFKHITKYSYLDSTSSTGWYRLFQYDASTYNRSTRTQYNVSNTGASTLSSNGTYSYSQGTARLDRTSSTGSSLGYFLFYYDATGYVTREEYYSSTGALSGYDVFVNDASGNQISDIYYTGAGTKNSSYISTSLDSKGNWLGETDTYYDSTGTNVTETDVYTTTNTYDQDGYLTIASSTGTRTWTGGTLGTDAWSTTAVWTAY